MVMQYQGAAAWWVAAAVKQATATRYSQPTISRRRKIKARPGYGNSIQCWTHRWQQRSKAVIKGNNKLAMAM